MTATSWNSFAIEAIVIEDENMQKAYRMSNLLSYTVAIDKLKLKFLHAFMPRIISNSTLWQRIGREVPPIRIRKRKNVEPAKCTSYQYQHLQYYFVV